MSLRALCFYSTEAGCRETIANVARLNATIYVVPISGLSGLYSGRLFINVHIHVLIFPKRSWESSSSCFDVFGMPIVLPHPALVSLTCVVLAFECQMIIIQK
jgi:hypothetical protein